MLSCDRRVVLGGLFGEEPAALSYRRLDCFRELGGCAVDTAHSYGSGAAEEVIGSWLRSRRCRDEFAVIDKVCHPDDNGERRVHPNVLRAELDVSLRRLDTDYLDVLLLHRDDPAVPVEDLLCPLLDEIATGRIRGFGISNWALPRMTRFIELARSEGHVPLASYQFSLAVPTREIWPGAMHADERIVGLLRKHDIPLLAWAAQACGWFADAVSPMDGAQKDPFETARNREARDRCRTLAAAVGLAPSTVALAWTLNQQFGVWAAVGARNEVEIAASMAAATVVFSPDELSYLGRRGSPPWAAGTSVSHRTDPDC